MVGSIDLPLVSAYGSIEDEEPSQHVSSEQNLVEHMARFRADPLHFFHELSLFVKGVGWRAYDPEHVIGQPAFYSGYTDKIRSVILTSPLLRRKLDCMTNARVELEVEEGLLDRDSPTFVADREHRADFIQKSLTQITDKMIDNMICKMESRTFIRTAYYVATQLLTRAYHQGIHVSRDEVACLKKIATVAAEKKRSIIFLPRHSSHIDYISLQLICFRLGITLPVVVAGDNLNFPLVGPRLQSAGAMWIRRSFDGDPLYTTLVQSYLDSMLQQGYNLECFIEGTRSRTGKLLNPKFGILSFLLDSIISGRVDDAYICPISTQYDKVIEVDTYVNELLGQPKKKENLQDFLAASSLLSLRLGSIHCRFHEPWSLKDFIEEQRIRPSQPLAGDTVSSGHDATSRTRILRTLGYKVLSDINSVAVIMPAALVGTVLLTLRGRGVTKPELIRRVEWLCQRIEENGGQVADFHGVSTEMVVDRAIRVLGPSLIGKVEGLVDDTFYAVDRFQLSFYRNMTIHLFMPEALVSIALYTRVKQGGGHLDQRMTESELTEKVTFLSQLFRGEFIFPAGRGLDANLQQAVQALQAHQVLEIEPDANNTRHIGLSTLERQSGRENYDFYCFLLWPFVEACWLGAVSLFSLCPPKNGATAFLDFKKVQDSAQLLGKTLYHSGDLSYFEAVNKEVLKNAYARFQEEGMIIVSKSRTSKVGPTIRLAPEWTPQRHPETDALIASGRLWEFTDRVSQCRREGKNRRDGATVSTRVLALVQKLGDGLFREQSATEDADAELKNTAVRRRSRL